MELTVIRYASGSESTLGMLLIDGQFECYTLEDEYRTEKKYGETRIPAGQYKLGLRNEGNFHQRYEEKFRGMHNGMLQVLDVPGFEYILIHVGNKDEDTAGCLLVGDSANNNLIDDGFISHSTAAYQRLYPKVANTLASGTDVSIEYRDGISNAPITTSPGVTPAGQPGFVRTARLNLRLGPGSSELRMGVLTQGTPVEIDTNEGDWCEVTLRGWVDSSFIEKL